MSNAFIEITLHGGETVEEDVDDLQRYVPGGTVRGSIRVTADADVSCKHLWARLQWHTEGRGDRDEGGVAEQDLFQGKLPARVPTSYDFAFTLPHEPWSYAGHLVSVVWEIAVSLDVPWGVDPR